MATTRAPLDPKAPEPLWSQLARVLKQRLGTGEYAERFPTEMDLTTEFEVSRATVREAIRRLKDEGLLDARRGSGTFVVRRQLDQAVIGNPGLARAIAAAGMEEQSEVLRFAEGPVALGAGEAGRAAAAALGLAHDEVVVWLERLRSADGRRVALDVSAIALSEAKRLVLLGADLQKGSLYDALAERCGVQVTGAVEQVRAVRCSAEDRELLDLDDDEGVLEVERVTYAGDVPVEWRRSLLRGSAYVLGASWGVTPAGA